MSQAPGAHVSASAMSGTLTGKMPPKLRELALKGFSKSDRIIPIRKSVFPHEKIIPKLVGRVCSTKMNKTINVAVDSFRWHTKIEKIVRKTSKVMAHDEGC